MRHRIQTTKTQQFIDITDQVALRSETARYGRIAVIYVPHTTAGVTLTKMPTRMWCGHALPWTKPILYGENTCIRKGIPTLISRPRSWALPAR